MARRESVIDVMNKFAQKKLVLQPISPETIAYLAEAAHNTIANVDVLIRTAYEKELTLSENQIFTHHDGRCTECSRPCPHVQVQYEEVTTAPNPVDGGQEIRLEHERIRGHGSA
jgi:hypothetical protein